LDPGRRHFYRISIVPADRHGRVFGASVRRGFEETQIRRGFRVIQFNRAFFIRPDSMISIQSKQTEFHVSQRKYINSYGER